MILVTGARGTVGREVVRQLLDAGAPVRALTRDRGRPGLPGGVEVAEGDLGDAGTLVPALAGVSRAYLPVGRDQQGGELVRAAVDAGVEHIVLLSSLAVEVAPR